MPSDDDPTGCVTAFRTAISDSDAIDHGRFRGPMQVPSAPPPVVIGGGLIRRDGPRGGVVTQRSAKQGGLRAISRPSSEKGHVLEAFRFAFGTNSAKELAEATGLAARYISQLEVQKTLPRSASISLRFKTPTRPGR
jgi:hypothetical protein